jgi:cyclophilin family peptidyl-prolyl cis-trans isomerase
MLVVFPPRTTGRINRTTVPALESGKLWQCGAVSLRGFSMPTVGYGACWHGSQDSNPKKPTSLVDEVETPDPAAAVRSPEDIAREFIANHGSYEPVTIDAPARRRRLIWWVGIVLVAALVVAAFLVLDSTPTASPHQGATTSTTHPLGSAAAQAQAAVDRQVARAGCSTKPAVPDIASARTVIKSHTLYAAVVATTAGTFNIAINPLSPPKAVNNFVYLAEKGYYDCDAFSRVVPGELLQVHSPTGIARGGAGFVGRGNQLAGQYPLGSVAVSTTPSQSTAWFIVTSPQGEALSDTDIVFGNVYAGIDVIESINAEGSSSGKPIVVHRILSVKIERRIA